MNAVSSRHLAGVVMLVAAVLATACSTTPPAPAHGEAHRREGAVSYEKLAASTNEQYKLTQSQHAFGAQPITNDPPAYPEALVGKGLPLVTIRVKAIVDDQGNVSDVRDLDALKDPERLAFVQACRSAVMNWKFTPMTVVQESDDGRGNISQVRKTAAFSLDYAFRFEIVDGRPQVTAGH